MDKSAAVGLYHTRKITIRPSRNNPNELNPPDLLDKIVQYAPNIRELQLAHQVQYLVRLFRALYTAKAAVPLKDIETKGAMVQAANAAKEHIEVILPWKEPVIVPKVLVVRDPAARPLFQKFKDDYRKLYASEIDLALEIGELLANHREFVPGTLKRLISPLEDVVKTIRWMHMEIGRAIQELYIIEACESKTDFHKAIHDLCLFCLDCRNKRPNSALAVCGDCAGPGSITIYGYESSECKIAIKQFSTLREKQQTAIQLNNESRYNAFAEMQRGAILEHLSVLLEDGEDLIAKATDWKNLAQTNLHKPFQVTLQRNAHTDKVAHLQKEVLVALNRKTDTTSPYSTAAEYDRLENNPARKIFHQLKLLDASGWKLADGALAWKRLLTVTCSLRLLKLNIACSS